MEKIDWIRKLTSRKFWLAIASFVSMLIVACGGTENQSAQAVALIMAGATVVAYIFGEGFADGYHEYLTTLEGLAKLPNIRICRSPLNQAPEETAFCIQKAESLLWGN